MSTLTVESGAPLGGGTAMRRSLVSPVVAGTLAILAAVLGWRGVDLPAQVYRVILFHREGLTLWDSQWYGGHWTFNYSVIFPPVAGLIGVVATGVLSAILAAWAFDRLVIGHFGESARFGSLVFAFGTVAQIAIGQLPFLLGEALALAAGLAATRRRWPAAVALALASALASPLAGAFLGLAVAAALLSTWPRHRLGIAFVAGAVGLPLLVVAVLFPGQGVFPYPAIDFLWEVIIGVGLWVLGPRQDKGFRNAVRVYIAASALSFVLPSPVGGNVGRLSECFALPIAVCLLWPLRRWFVLTVVAIPLALWQWTPAWGAITQNGRDPSTHTAYYQPLVRFLLAHNDPTGRVEVVPTSLHWEVAYVAPTIALARGWERQLDTANNGLFYTDAALTAASYRAWLLDNGVRYVALPDAPLDYAAVAEGQLVQAGVDGLRLAWHDAHWKVFEVTGAPGIVEGPARLRSLSGGQIFLHATGPGQILVRVRDPLHWEIVSGQGCVGATPTGWTTINVPGPEELHLQLRLVASAGAPC
jgi:hypothetical protein